VKLEFIYNVSTVRINGEVFDIGDFLEIAPDFKPPKSLSNIHYIPSERHTRIENGIPRNHPTIWDEGDYYISRLNDLKRFINYQESLNIKKPEPHTKNKPDKKINPDDPYDINRKKEYPEIEELVVALWEHIVEGRNLADSEIEILENIRSAVKSRYHKK